MLNATCRLVVRQRSVAMDPWILDPQTAGETQNFLESTPLSFLRAGPPNFRRISAESRAHPNFDKKFAKLGPRPNNDAGGRFYILFRVAGTHTRVTRSVPTAALMTDIQDWDDIREGHARRFGERNDKNPGKTSQQFSQQVRSLKTWLV